MEPWVRESLQLRALSLQLRVLFYIRHGADIPSSWKAVALTLKRVSEWRYSIQAVSLLASLRFGCFLDNFLPDNSFSRMNEVKGSSVGA